MQVKNFSFPLNNPLVINYENGTTSSILLDNNSGRGIFRDKIDSLVNVKHTGIYVGTDTNTKQAIVIHNHYNYGSAYVTDILDFARNKNVSWLTTGCENTPLQVITKALHHVQSGERYKPKSYNCQTLVNSACNNKRYSEDASRIATGVFCAVVIGSFFWLAPKLFSNT